MTIGTSLFMITVGAILRYAVKDTWDAVNIPTVGLILMLVGALGLALGIYFTFIRRDPRAPERIVGEPPPPPRY
jgi:uncharacterized membrane protein YfcA